MEQLVKTYGFWNLVSIVITLSLGTKAFVTFVEWAYKELKTFFSISFEEENETEMLKKEIANQKKINEELMNIVKDLSGQVKILIDSDRDDIKAYITERHHFFCYNQKWIDDYSLECLEKRFENYRRENGNSFVEGFMRELRKLPKVPPTE